MKAGDYKTFTQAEEYHLRRFKNGLEIINRDEMNVLDNWLDDIRIKDKLILDLGTGTGRVITNLLARKVKKIYALDQSKAMLNFFRKIYNKEIKRGTVETVNAPSNKIPLALKSIDLITAFHLFKHLPDIGQTLEQVNTVLKPGGYFIFDILNINSLIRFNLGTCYALSENQIKHILIQHGFRVKEIIYLHPLGETTYGIFGKILSIIPKTLDGVIGSLQLKAGTKIFVLAQKMKYE